jgi:hypothetical protein
MHRYYLRDFIESYIRRTYWYISFFKLRIGQIETVIRSGQDIEEVCQNEPLIESWTNWNEISSIQLRFRILFAEIIE